MSLATQINNMIAAVNGLMGVINGKLRSKADRAEIYTQTQLNDPATTLGANAATASTLRTSRTISLGGQATGSVGFDGSDNVTLVVTVPSLADKANKVDTLTPAQIDDRIQAVIGAAPGALDTLVEIAEALGNDPNFAASMTTELAKKANRAEVYTVAQIDASFVTKEGTAANAALLGGKASDHYATAAGQNSLEEQIGTAFQRLADSFNNGAAAINGTLTQ
ncbi:hypothetical protein [Enterovibrio norvegicus]|uniref:hypothetical protein n=1 Tax=Enterovibrio norvegicus TaxID=188144 RepID=UPI000C815EF3|nr:hypothetical protein [Enterovibrio norvegicus]PMN73149.1 hypothetical protein BCT27_12455 [Enterovibrio norvegicus]